MRTLVVEGSVKVPEGVTVEVKARKVTVTGPRGKNSLLAPFSPCCYGLSTYRHSLRLEREPGLPAAGADVCLCAFSFFVCIFHIIL